MKKRSGLAHFLKNKFVAFGDKLFRTKLLAPTNKRLNKMLTKLNLFIWESRAKQENKTPEVFSFRFSFVYQSLWLQISFCHCTIKQFLYYFFKLSTPGLLFRV